MTMMIDRNDLDSIELPPEVQAELSNEPDSEQRTKRLNELSQLMAGHRDEAVNGRKELGIEEIWKTYEEAYIGIDEVNQGQVGAPKWTKSPVMQGPLVSNTTDESGSTASVYVRLTARYVDAATAKIAEILLSPDEKSFSLKATPIPSARAESRDQVSKDGVPLERDPKPHELPAAGQSAMQSPQAMLQDAPTGQLPTGEGPGQPLTVADLAEEKLAEENKKASRAEKRIHDQFVEATYNSEARKVLFDAARIGVGVIKGPYSVRKKAKKFLRKQLESGKSIMQLEIEEKIVPGVKWVSPWDFFPDKHCGEDIHNGEQVWERDYVTEKALLGLKGVTGYLEEQIEAVIKEGPQKTNLMEDEVARKKALMNDNRYQIWYGQRHLTRDDLAFLNPDEAQRIPKDHDLVSVTVTMVNDTIIQAIPNMLDSGEFMYDTMSWQRRVGSWAGSGLGEQLDTPQRIVNGATRAMLRNAKNTAGGQVVIDRDSVQPADTAWDIYGDKIWTKKGNSIIDDVRKAFAVIPLLNVTPQLMTIIEYGFRLAEEVSNIPLISQGQSGKTAPETLGGMQLQDNNANQLLRHVATMYDDGITTRLIPRFGEWNMLDPDIPEDEKGDFYYHTQGSSALVERYTQDQVIAQMAAIVKDPAFGLNPRKWALMWLKSKKLNPEDLKFTKDELAKIDGQPPPPPPQVMAAQVNAEAALKRAETEHQFKLQELGIHERLEMLRYANQQQISLEQIKADLAKTTMELRTQIDLSTMDKTHEAAQVANSPAEPEGRAPDGEAFTK